LFVPDFQTAISIMPGVNLAINKVVQIFQNEKGHARNGY
jgi:hypothetical protein